MATTTGGKFITENGADKYNITNNNSNWQKAENDINEVENKVSLLEQNASWAAWSDITGKPAQATRWPSWGEVTGKSAKSPSESKSIPPNTDLNSYTTPGFYHSNYSANMKTVENHPSGQAGSLMVLKNAGTTQFWVNFWTGDTRMYVRNGLDGSWGAWRELGEYGVTESGSNENGSYIKFGDGTQICWHKQKGTTPNNAVGSLFRSTNNVWTFPATFIEIPSTFVGVARGVGYGWSALGSDADTKTSTSFSNYSPTSNPTIPTNNLLAIGRWK